MPSSLQTQHYPEAHARAAGLRYSVVEDPGYTRRRCGRGFMFLDPGGKRVTDPKVRERLQGLALPPAWNEVWICADPRGHLQAVGTDEAGRRQYRYHDRWSVWQQEVKFHRQVAFADRLPEVRRRIQRQLRRGGVDRESVLALIIRLLDDTHIRIGSERYRKRYRSYGLTTLRSRHIKRPEGDDGGTKNNGHAPRGDAKKGDDAASADPVCGLRLEFRGKSGVDVSVTVDDPMVQDLLLQLQDLPGQHLFQYVDPDGELHRIGSADVNAYIHTIMGEDFTAKDFRTWGATTVATQTLGEQTEAIEATDSERQLKKIYNEALDAAAARLHNTRAVVSSHYVNPKLWDAVQAKRIAEAFAAARSERHPRGLRVAERAAWHLVGGAEADAADIGVGASTK